LPLHNDEVAQLKYTPVAEVYDAIADGVKTKDDILVLFGGPKCSGKSYHADLVAKMLRTEFGYLATTLNFAAPLKIAAQSIYGVRNLLDTMRQKEWCRNEGVLSTPDLTELAKEIMAMPWRQRLQYLGTDIGRNSCNKDIWVSFAADAARKLLFDSGLLHQHAIIVDDWRFPNEYNFFDLVSPDTPTTYAIAIDIDQRTQVARGCEAGDKHASELKTNELYSLADYVIKTY